MSRYLFTEFAENPVVANGNTYTFEKVSFSSGHWWGVLEVPDAEAPGILAAARRVAECSREDYDKYLAQKKTTPSLNNSKPSNKLQRPVVQQKGPPIPIADRAGAVSAGGNEPKPEPAAPAQEFPAVSDVIKVDRVAPPQPIVEGDRRVGEPKKRSKNK